MIKLSYQLKAMIAAGSLAAVVALYAMLVFLSRVVSTGGIDSTHSQVILSSGGICAFLIGWAALVFTRQLFAAAKDERKAASR